MTFFTVLVALSCLAFGGFFEVGAAYQDQRIAVGFVLSPEIAFHRMEGLFRFDFFFTLEEGELRLLPFVFDNPVYFKFDVENFKAEYSFLNEVPLNSFLIPTQKFLDLKIKGLGGLALDDRRRCVYLERPIVLVVSDRGEYHVGVDLKFPGFTVQPFLEKENFGVWISKGGLSVMLGKGVMVDFKGENAVLRVGYAEGFLLEFGLMLREGWVLFNQDGLEFSWKVGKINAGGKVSKERVAVQLTFEF